MTKRLPALTICPWPAFKTKGFHYTKEQFEKQTYTLEDLLNTSHVPGRYSNMKDVDVKVTKSIALGKCFTMKISKAVSLGEPFIFHLKRTWDVTIFVHNDDEEFWFSWSAYPPPLNKFRLNIKTDNNSFVSELRVAEKQSISYPKATRPCKAPSSVNNRESILKDAADHRLNFRSFN